MGCRWDLRVLGPVRGAPVLVAWDVRRLIVDEKTIEFLRVMREQIRGTNSREVNSRKAARELVMAPGYPEYENRLADLMWARYLHPHPNSRLYRHGVP